MIDGHTAGVIILENRDNAVMFENVGNTIQIHNFIKYMAETMRNYTTNLK